MLRAVTKLNEGVSAGNRRRNRQDEHIGHTEETQTHDEVKQTCFALPIWVITS